MSSANFPLAVVIGYGPDHETVTKIVASVFTRPGQAEPFAMQKWFAKEGDLRQDATTMAAVDDFIKHHYAAGNVAYKWSAGCPHEEGIDYPEGGVCPQCPFWANLDRHTLEPKSLDAPLTPKQILAGLSCERDTQPLVVFDAVEQYREQMIEPFLQTAERILNNPKNVSVDDSELFSYALAFLAKWREPRVYPLVIQWLSMPDDDAFDLGGDTATEWGSRMLATVCGGDVVPIKQLIENRAANEFCRSQGVEALAILAAWKERSQAEVADYFGWLVREGLEREPSAVWDSLVSACADIEATALLKELRGIGDEDLLDSVYLEEEIEDLEAEPRGMRIALFGEFQEPFGDVAEETGWWACFSRSQENAFPPEPSFNEPFRPDAYIGPDPADVPQPYIAPPKIGRNEPCPCGSGKKYKKCCGA